MIFFTFIRHAPASPLLLRMSVPCVSARRSDGTIIRSPHRCPSPYTTPCRHQPYFSAASSTALYYDACRRQSPSVARPSAITTRDAHHARRLSYRADRSCDYAQQKSAVACVRRRRRTRVVRRRRTVSSAAYACRAEAERRRAYEAAVGSGARRAECGAVRQRAAMCVMRANRPRRGAE